MDLLVCLGLCACMILFLNLINGLVLLVFYVFGQKLMPSTKQRIDSAKNKLLRSTAMQQMFIWVLFWGDGIPRKY